MSRSKHPSKPLIERLRVRRRQFLTLSAAVVAAPLMPAVAAPLDYPVRPITIVVPFAAGGPLDTYARILVERMRVVLGKPVVIENITGAGGSIGTGRVARAAPDGYQLIFGGWATHVVNGALLKLSYDVAKDFEPVAQVASQPLLLVGNTAVPATTLKEVIAWLAANPDKATFGQSGTGSATHIAAVFFQRETRTRFASVSYRGAAQAIQDLVAGQIDLKFEQPATALPLIRAGRVKAYAVTAPRRLSAAPDIPTMDEAGLPGLHVSLWNAIFAPQGTPAPVIAKLNDAITDALADRALHMRLSELGLEIPPREEQSPQALAALQSAEIARWWPIVKAAGIKVE
ncbi:MAG: tripartite tricarboxylate transporter substrate binding protein BugD [Hyphomicrobiales bacterium]|nr:tripartite tricarboxylate transporter substrate binding protein BugD [Hyphomicrobiales bacterium]